MNTEEYNRENLYSVDSEDVHGIYVDEELSESLQKKSAIFCYVLYAIYIIASLVSVCYLFSELFESSPDAEDLLYNAIVLLVSLFSILGVSVFKKICNVLIVLLDDCNRRNS